MNRSAVTSKHLLILTSSHKQGTVRFAHFYTRRPLLLEAFPFLCTFHWFLAQLLLRNWCEKLHREKNHQKHIWPKMPSNYWIPWISVLIMCVNICSYLWKNILDIFDVINCTSEVDFQQTLYFFSLSTCCFFSSGSRWVKEEAKGDRQKSKRQNVSRGTGNTWFLFPVFCIQHPWCCKPLCPLGSSVPFANTLFVFCGPANLQASPCLQPTLPRQSYFLIFLKCYCNNSCFYHISKHLWFFLCL